jgi:hypothetical protein
MSKGGRKKQIRLERQLELLKNFNQENDHYEEKMVGDSFYVKNFNGCNSRWQVCIYTKDAFIKYKRFKHPDFDIDNWTK